MYFLSTRFEFETNEVVKVYIKDYDFTIAYHSSKVNVITNGHSQQIWRV